MVDSIETPHGDHVDRTAATNATANAAMTREDTRTPTNRGLAERYARNSQKSGMVEKTSHQGEIGGGRRRSGNIFWAAVADVNYGARNSRLRGRLILGSLRTRAHHPISCETTIRGGGSVVLTLSGDLDSQGASDIEPELRWAATNADETVAVDCAALEEVDLVGLAALANAEALARDRHVGFQLVAASPAVRDSIRAAGLEGLLVVND
jgi:anti-anti-sigma factor